MEANELRVGNWIFCETLKKPIMVRPLEIECAFELEGHFNTTFSPIPLTEEILLKCGFTHVDSDYITHDSGEMAWSTYKHKKVRREITYRHDENVYYYDGYDYTTLTYLHQLQNLYFALTGQELEINL